MVLVIFFAFILPAFIIGFNIWRILIYYRRTGRFVKVAGRVTGNTVQHGASRRSPSHYAPIIEFETKDGVRIEGVYSQDNPDRPLYIPGEAVTICYDPDEPRRFLIHDAKAEYLVSIAGIVIGLAIWFFVAKAIWF
jgi:Protein of unknown function (DUF3592)